MALTDARAKAATVPEGKKQIKLSDGGGLFLLVTRAGGKRWNMKYRYGGKEKTLSIGTYPKISLKEARLSRDRAKKLLDANIDPSQSKQADRRKEQVLGQINTFGGVAAEWMAKHAGTWATVTTKHKQAELDRHILPWIGSLPIAEIEAPDLLSVIQRAENRGTIETAHRLKMTCGQVFNFAIVTGRVKSNPARDLTGAIAPVSTTHRPCIKTGKEFGMLLRAIEGFQGTFIVQCAMQISPYVFARPGELRKAEWSEIDLANAEWRIPADKMKMKAAHIVPLALQVVNILKELHPLTGNGRYVFPSIRTATRPMSENTINATLRRLGYDTRIEHCAHGFRGTASTMLHEQGWPSDTIERQLAHKEGNAIKGAYNHARHLPERIKLMQQWADYIDGLRAGVDIIPIGKRAA